MNLSSFINDKLKQFYVYVVLSGTLLKKSNRLKIVKYNERWTFKAIDDLLDFRNEFSSYETMERGGARVPELRSVYTERDRERGLAALV